MLKAAVALTSFFLFINNLFAQADEKQRGWNKPVDPFRIIGNLYYVGANEICSYLITTPEGHFLLDGGFVETAPQIERNIAELGFKLANVKFLLNSHAHFDHAGGISTMSGRLKSVRISSLRQKDISSSMAVSWRPRLRSRRKCPS